MYLFLYKVGEADSNMEPQAAPETETTAIADDYKIVASPVEEVSANIVKEIEQERPKKAEHKEETEVCNLSILS